MYGAVAAGMGRRNRRANTPQTRCENGANAAQKGRNRTAVAAQSPHGAGVGVPLQPPWAPRFQVGRLPRATLTLPPHPCIPGPGKAAGQGGQPSRQPQFFGKERAKSDNFA